MSIQPLIKICGVKEVSTAQKAVNIGADYIGLMFYKKSTRFVDLDRAKVIAKTVKKMGGKPVGVFVDHDAKVIKTICQQVGLDIVQLHGNISRQQHSQLPHNFQRIYVMQVNIAGEVQDDVDRGFQNLQKERDLLLFDREKGGGGEVFNWQQFHNPYPYNYLLAGGLTPDNIKNALRLLQPYGVDVSSGVEDEAGEKSMALIERFIIGAKGKLNV